MKRKSPLLRQTLDGRIETLGVRADGTYEAEWVELVGPGPWQIKRRKKDGKEFIALRRV